MHRLFHFLGVFELLIQNHRHAKTTDVLGSRSFDESFASRLEACGKFCAWVLPQRELNIAKDDRQTLLRLDWSRLSSDFKFNHDAWRVVLGFFRDKLRIKAFKTEGRCGKEPTYENKTFPCLDS